MATIAQIGAKLFLDVADYNKGIQQADKNTKGFQKTLGSINQLIGKTIVASIGAATVALGAFAKGAIETGAAFQTSLATVAAVKGFRDIGDATSEGAKQLALFEERARELGASTAFSATQASDAMIELARAGLSANDVIGAIGPALFLAGSSASSMSSATSLLAATMKQFDLSAADATRVSDVFTIAQQKSLFAMDSLTEAMKFGGTVGSAFGMSLEETTAALAQFRDLGVEGSMAGTQFRQAMIALANPTAKAKKVLEEYGLTVDDVSPATNSFTEILETLGKANMSLANITDLVSKRASGSFVKLIDKFKEGTSTYNELITAFQTGGGAAEDTYNTMIDTVAGRFSILKSAFEELQLTFFDTFSEPLRDAIGGDDDSGLIGLVNTLSKAFQASAGTFRQVFGDIFGSTLQAINNNSQQIAISIASVVVQAAYLGKTFISLIPTLTKLGSIVLTVFVTGKVIAMAQAVATFTTGLYSAVVAAGSLRAAMTAAVAASGGLVAVVAGVATLTTIMATYVFQTSKAAQATADLTQSLNAASDARDNFNQSMIQGERAGVNAQTAQTIELIKEEVAQNEQLNQTLESQLNKLAQLDEKAQNTKITKGELFQVDLDGEKVLVDQATALSLSTTKLGENNDIMQQVIDRQQELADATQTAKGAFGSNVAVIERITDAQQQYNDGLIDADTFTTIASGASSAWNGTLSAQVSNVSSVESVLREMNNTLIATQEQYVLTKKASQGFDNALAQSQAALAARRAKQTADQLRQERSERKRANEQFLKDRKKAIDARLKLEQELQNQLELLRADENDKLAVQLQQRLANVRKVYDEELKFARGNKAKQLEIEQGYQQTIQGILEQATTAQINSARSSAREIEQQNIRFADNERQRLQSELQDRITEEENALQSIQNATIAANDERRANIEKQVADKLITEQQGNAQLLQIDQAQQQTLLNAQQAFDQKTNALRQQSALKQQQIDEDIKRTIIDERLALEERGILRELELRQQAQLAQLRLAGATAEQIASVEKIYQAQRAQAEQDLIDQFVQPYGEYTKRIDDLQRQSLNARTDRAKEQADKEIEFLQKRFALEQKLETTRIATEGDEEIQAQAIARVREEIELLNEEYEKSGNSLRDMGERAVSSFQKIASGVGKALSAVVGFAKQAGQAIGQGLESGLSFFTGGAATMNIGGILSQAASASMEAQKAGKEQQAALQEQLKAGEITQEEFDQATAGGLGVVDPAEQAKEFIDELLSSATGFAMAIAEQAPLIIDGLASALPILIDALVVAIPVVIRALGDGLPTVVFALVDGIIALLPVLADALLNDALPKVIDGIITLLTVKLPELAETLTPIVADLVQFIIEQAPRIVNAITSALPTVIDFLVTGITQILTGIPTLIETLLAAIPVIITELLGGISDLVMVVFQAIPMIIEKVIMALPDIISALLRGLLGVLVELASALPMLIAEIINLLPVLLSAIIALIPEIIIALVEALPTIIENLILALPLIITALINLIPSLIFEIIRALPRLVTVLVTSIIDLLLVQIPRLAVALATGIATAITSAITETINNIQTLFELIPQVATDLFDIVTSLPERIRDGLTQGLDQVVAFFRDVITEITSLGRAETATFNDTPGAIQAGASGLTASFAPDDYIIAAQKPMDLLQQAMGAVGSQLPKSLTSMFAKSFPPTMTQPNVTSGTSASTTTNITIQAEGRVLDDIQVKALERGHAPKMERKLKKASGAKVGFDRGRFNGFGK